MKSEEIKNRVQWTQQQLGKAVSVNAPASKIESLKARLQQLELQAKRVEQRVSKTARQQEKVRLILVGRFAEARLNQDHRLAKDWAQGMLEWTQQRPGDLVLLQQGDWWPFSSHGQPGQPEAARERVGDPVDDLDADIAVLAELSKTRGNQK